MATFETLAPTYDTDFTHTRIGQSLRNRVHDRLLAHFSAGDHVLELGCGTGEDALFLARQGVRITATDASDAMLSMAREKTAHTHLVDVQKLDLQSCGDAINRVPDAMKYTGVFSNFGALNCLDDWRPLARFLAEVVPSGGVVAFGVMSPYCLWELLWHGAHLDFGVATRRLRGSTFGTMHITYPTVRRLTRDFAPDFERTSVMPLGLFLPPSDVFGVIEKRPRLLATLTHLEDRFGSASPLAPFADHYWIEFVKR